VTSTLWRAPEGPVKLRYSTIGDFEFRAGRLLGRSKGSRTYQGDAPAGSHRTLVRQAREAMYTELTPALPLVMSNPGMKILSTRTGSPGTTAENLAHGLLSRNHATAPELHSEVHTGLGLARSTDRIWQLPVEQIKERTRRHDSDAFVFTECQQIWIAGHHECRAAFDGSCHVLASGSLHSRGISTSLVTSWDHDVLKPEFRINARASQPFEPWGRRVTGEPLRRWVRSIQFRTRGLAGSVR
jgi:hypothetical protein